MFPETNGELGGAVIWTSRQIFWLVPQAPVAFTQICPEGPFPQSTMTLVEPCPDAMVPPVIVPVQPVELATGGMLYASCAPEHTVLSPCGIPGAGAGVILTSVQVGALVPQLLTDEEHICPETLLFQVTSMELPVVLQLIN